MLDRNFAIAGFDRTHVFQMGFVYELPFAKNSNSILGQHREELADQRHRRRVLRHAVLDHRHEPAAQLPGLRQGTFIRSTCRAIPSRPARPARATEPWYDKSLFSQPTGANVAGFGNSRRNQFRTPGVWNVDLGLFRSFPVGRFRPEIRIEAHERVQPHQLGPAEPHLHQPVFMTFRPAAAHQVNTTGARATRERTVQVGLRLEF